MATNEQVRQVLAARGMQPTPANMQVVLDAVARDPSVLDFMKTGTSNNEDDRFVADRMTRMLQPSAPATVSPTGPVPVEGGTMQTPVRAIAPAAGARKLPPVDNTAAGSAVTPEGSRAKLPITSAAAAPASSGDDGWAGLLPLIGMLLGGGQRAGAALGGRVGNPGDDVNMLGIRTGQMIGAEPTPKPPLEAQYGGRMPNVDNTGTTPQLTAPPKKLPTPNPDGTTTALMPPARALPAGDNTSVLLERMLALPNPGDIPTYPSGAPKLPPQPRPGSDAERRARAAIARDTARGVSGSR